MRDTTPTLPAEPHATPEPDPDTVGHWTVNGLPACVSPLLRGEIALAPACACSGADFKQALPRLERHETLRHAWLQWHPTGCPRPESGSYEDEEDPRTEALYDTLRRVSKDLSVTLDRPYSERAEAVVLYQQQLITWLRRELQWEPES